MLQIWFSWGLHSVLWFITELVVFSCAAWIFYPFWKLLSNSYITLNSIVGQFSSLKLPHSRSYSFHFLMFIFYVLCRVCSKIMVTGYSLPPQKIIRIQQANWILAFVLRLRREIFSLMLWMLNCRAIFFIWSPWQNINFVIIGTD